MTIDIRVAYTKTGVIYHHDCFDIVGKYNTQKYDKFGYPIATKNLQTEKDCTHWQHSFSNKIYSSFDAAYSAALKIVQID